MELNELRLFNDSEKSILDRIKSGDQRALEKLYHDSRAPFIAWTLQRYSGLSDDIVVDIYQRSFMVMYFNIKNGKLTTLTSNLKTYLFSIGKNLLKEHYRSKNDKYLNLDDHVGSIDTGVDNTAMDAFNRSHEKELVKALLEKIGDPCKRLLEMMYIHGYSTEAVVEEMGYSDERVVRKRKFLCIQQLRDMMRNTKDIL